jgi:hypothetical protein
VPALVIDRFGFGAGSRDDESRPNMLKLCIGDMQTADLVESGHLMDNVTLLETNIDDMDPRVYPYITDKLLQQGCLDVWLTQVLMKKGRPGIVLNVLVSTENEQCAVNTIFKETTTIGIRKLPVSRYILPRTKQGNHKISYLPDGTQKKSVEYETAVRQIKQTKKPLHKHL